MHVKCESVARGTKVSFDSFSYSERTLRVKLKTIKLVCLRNFGFDTEPDGINFSLRKGNQERNELHPLYPVCKSNRGNHLCQRAMAHHN